jgi:hypothetical protein
MEKKMLFFFFFLKKGPPLLGNDHGLNDSLSLPTQIKFCLVIRSQSSQNIN